MYTEGFSEWIQSELDKRAWRQADLAERAHMSSSLVSKLMSGQRNPGPDTCRAIARAFGMPPEEVQRHAGLLPSLPEEDSTIRRITLRLRELLNDERGQAVLPQIDVIVDALYRQTFGSGTAPQAPNTLTDEKPSYAVSQRRRSLEKSE